MSTLDATVSMPEAMPEDAGIKSHPLVTPASTSSTLRKFRRPQSRRCLMFFPLVPALLVT